MTCFKTVERSYTKKKQGEKKNKGRVVVSITMFTDNILEWMCCNMLYWRDHKQKIQKI